MSYLMDKCQELSKRYEVYFDKREKETDLKEKKKISEIKLRDIFNRASYTQLELLDKPEVVAEIYDKEIKELDILYKLRFVQHYLCKDDSEKILIRDRMNVIRDLAVHFADQRAQVLLTKSGGYKNK